jgi:cell division protein FtsB
MLAEQQELQELEDNAKALEERIENLEHALIPYYS